MFRRGIVLAGCFMLAFFMTIAPSQSQSDSFAAGAGKFIQSLANRSIAELTEDGLSTGERRKRFRVILNNEFAVKTIGRWVLGRYWRQATDAQRAEYLKLFENLLVVTYADRFADYKGEKLSVIKSMAKGKKDIVVFTKIRKPNDPKPVEIQWRVRAKEGKYIIIDVMVAGISMGQSQRSEFASVIRRNGGDLDLFLEDMRNQKNIGMLKTTVWKNE